MQLRENVGAPGLRAIKAVLLLDENNSMLVSDAVRDCGTSKASIRKYRELISALKSQHESSILAGGSANPCLLSPPSSETDHTSGVRPFYGPFGVALFRNRDCLLLCAWTGYWFEQVVWLLVGGVREGRVAASGEDPSGVSTHSTDLVAQIYCRRSSIPHPPALSPYVPLPIDVPASPPPPSPLSRSSALALAVALAVDPSHGLPLPQPAPLHQRPLPSPASKLL